MANETSETAVKRAGAALPGVLFLLVMLAGAVSLVFAVATGRITPPSAPTFSTFMAGQLTSQVSASLAEAPFPKFMADMERGGSWLLLDSLGPRVRQGCAGWLFLVDELVVHPQAEKDSLRRLRAAVALRERLAKQDIELLVVLVPDKSRIQHEQLCGLYRPPVLDARLRWWAEGAGEAGLRVVNLDTVLSRQALASDAAAPFLRTDTHWSEAGAERAAQRVARAVEQLQSDIQPIAHYRMEQGPVRTREGDLVRLAGIAWLPEALQPTPDRVQSGTFHESVTSPPDQASDGSPPAEDDGADLFGDEDLPSVALIGTSFSRTSSFVPYLDASLSTRVTSFARDGGDFWGAAQYYFSSPSFTETPPRVVIWEIPERVLQMPIKAGECRWMAELSDPVSADTMPECNVN